VPILDEAGFVALLEQGPDTVRPPAPDDAAADAADDADVPAQAAEPPD